MVKSRCGDVETWFADSVLDSGLIGLIEMIQ
jgi:hypothetical protein